jgi:hypothetical protein
MICKTMVNHLLVERLATFWNPLKALRLRLTLDDVLAVDPLSTYKEDHRGRGYDKRRIRYFVDQIRSGKDLEPIVIDNHCDSSYIYPLPLVVDGNHRFIACLLTQRKTISASYGGRVDLLHYLEGKRKTCPEE